MKQVSQKKKDLAEKLFRAKVARRRQLAALPIEEKIKILVAMQRLANDVRRKTGRQPLPEWDIET